MARKRGWGKTTTLINSIVCQINVEKIAHLEIDVIEVFFVFLL